MKGEQFSTFQYFLECYFNMSADYDEIDNIVQEFYDTESIQYQRSLNDEVRYVLMHHKENRICEFIQEHGKRRMDADKILWLCNKILRK